MIVRKGNCTMTIFNLNFKENATSNKIQTNQTANKYALLARNIEDTAHLMHTQKNLGAGIYAQLQYELVALLLSIKKLNKFVPGNANSEDLLEYEGNARNYSGVVFTECYNYAWKCYGTLDKETHQLVPFLHWFNYLYSIKQNDIVAEKALDARAWDNKCKKEKLSELLRNAIVEYGYTEPLPRINVLNLEALLGQLRTIGADEALLEKAQDIYAANYVQSDACVSIQDRAASDEREIEDQEYADSVIYFLATAIEKLQEEAQSWSDPVVRNNLIFYVTLKAREYLKTGDESLVILLKEYIDKDLLRYAESHDSGNDVSIFAEYTHQQYDTARKKLRKVEKAFQEMAI